MPLSCLRVDLAAGIDERAAQLSQDQRAPVQADQPAKVKVDQKPARGAAEQGVGVGDNGDHRRSAREDLVVEFGAEMSERAPAARLFAAMPGLDGGLEHPPLVTHLLVQWNVAGLDAGHDVGA